MESLAYLHLAASVEADLSPLVADTSVSIKVSRDCCNSLGRNWRSTRFWLRLLAITANLTILAIATQVYAQTLQYGDEGAEVAALQQCLVDKGYLETSTFGNFSDKTRAAVQQFQRDQGLDDDGVVGSQTAAALGCNLTVATTGNSEIYNYPSAVPYNFPAPSISSSANQSTAYASPTRPTLAFGDRGSAVSDLQRRLRSQGYYLGEIDGDFGPATQQAVIQLQRANNLRADGVVGPTTWTALGTKDGGSQRERLAEQFGVVALQRQLKEKGFYTGQIDGSMGRETQRAIAAAQRFYGVSDSEILSGRLPR